MLINKLLFYALLLTWTNCFAQVKLLQCLGREEARLYKQKAHGSTFELNQKLVNTLVNSPDLKLAREFEQAICESPTPARRTLFYGIIYAQKLFQIHNTTERRQANFFLSTLPKLLFTYLSLLQAEMPQAHCLEKLVPEIPYYLDRFKYLETELPVSVLLSDKQRLRSLMKNLEDKHSLLQRCLKLIKK